MQFFLAPNLWIAYNSILLLEFSWFEVSEEVNFCEARLTLSINQMHILLVNTCHISLQQNNVVSLQRFLGL